MDRIALRDEIARFVDDLGENIEVWTVIESVDIEADAATQTVDREREVIDVGVRLDDTFG